MATVSQVSKPTMYLKDDRINKLDYDLKLMSTGKYTTTSVRKHGGYVRESRR